MSSLTFTKEPNVICNNLNEIVSHYNDFNKNMTLASACIEVMKKSWFGKECDQFITIWNKNIDVVNSYLDGICKDSSNLNLRFKEISRILGYSIPDIIPKSLALSKFPAGRANTGKLDTELLQKNLTEYNNDMLNAIKSLKSLISKVTPNSIGIIDNSNGGTGTDIKKFNKDVTLVNEQITSLHNNTEEFVSITINLLNTANANH